MTCSTTVRGEAPVHHLLDRLDRIRETGPGRWIACCPAHDDRSPSLSIRELEDGRILLHDFAGCEVHSILNAVGLTFSDLFPERLAEHLPRTRDRRHWHAAREALKSLSDDALLVVIAAENVAAGVVLSEKDRDLLTEVAARIRGTREVAA